MLSTFVSKVQSDRKKASIAGNDEAEEVHQMFLLKYSMWILLLLFSVVMATWQIQMLIMDFLSDPHYVSNSYFKSEKHSIFPNVTVCNFNRVNKSLINTYAPQAMVTVKRVNRKLFNKTAALKKYLLKFALPQKAKVGNELRTNATTTTWLNVVDLEGVVATPTPQGYYIRSLLWFALLVVCCWLTVWQTSEVIAEFRTPPHYVSSSYFKRDHSVSMGFPNITICNFNRANQSLAKEMGLDNLLIEHIFFAQVATYELSFYEYEERMEEATLVWQRHKNRTDIPEKLKDAGHLLRHLGHSCAKTMRICIFGAERFNCCENAVTVMNAEYGACWVINPPIFTENDTTPKQPWRGISGGFRAIVDPSVEDYLEGVTINNYLENGVMVAPNFNPYEAYYPEVVAVSPGTHARIAMSKRIRVSREPQFQVFERFCAENETLRYTLGKFDFTTCEDDCNQMIVMKECGCAQMQEMPKKYADVPTCDANQVLNCIDEVAEDSWLNTNSEADLRQCMERCMPTCKEMTDIFTVTSTTKWAGDQFKPTLPMFLRETYGIHLADNDRKKLDELILLDVFFPSTYYTMVEETEKTSLFSLVGNIGGHLGLWLGVSLITVVQLMTSAVHWAWSYDEIRRKKRKVGTVSADTLRGLKMPINVATLPIYQETTTDDDHMPPIAQ